MKGIGSVITVCLLLVLFSVQAEWKAAENPLMTRWGRAVTPENAWQEYPRPQMVRKDWQNLNGLWDYAITHMRAAQPKEFSGKILVPFCVESALSGVKKGLNPDQRIWYRRSFEVSNGWKGKRIILHFGAVDYECSVWVNGGLAGSHRGGFDPFSFDITPFLKEGAANELVLAVLDPSSKGEQPRGKQKLSQEGIWYTPVSGIWQTVWLEPVNGGMAIGDVLVVSDIDKGEIRVETTNDHEMALEHQVVRATVLDGGKEIAQGICKINYPMTIKMPNAKLWSPDSPHLYGLKVELFRKALNAQQKKDKERKRLDIDETVVEKDILLDSVDCYFAMRKIALGKGSKGATLELNNNPLFHYGPLDQGYWPEGLLTPPAPDAFRFEIDYLKSAGCNMLRKHIKVEPALYYAYCDQVGILVWQDMPSGMIDGGPQHRRPQFLTREMKEDRLHSQSAKTQYELEYRRMIDALDCFPSIVMWVPFNEGWGQYDTERIAKWTKNYDPTRLVNSVSGWYDVGAGDTMDTHVYHPERQNYPAPEPGRAPVLGEFGGFGLPVEGHLWWTNKRNWGYLTFTNQTEMVAQYQARLDDVIGLYQNNGLQAAVYTQTTDVEGEVNGYMTYDREVQKIEASELRKMHQPFFSHDHVGVERDSRWQPLEK